MPDKPDVALASMGIYVFETRVPVRPAAPRRRRSAARATISARTSFPTWSSTARRSRIASPSPACAASPRREAYWRDVGTIDAYWEANIDLTDFVPALDLYDQRLADLDLRRDHAAGQVRPRRGRPARHGDQLAGLGRLHHLGQPDRQVAAVHRRARPLLQRARATWWRCPTCRSTAARGCSKVVIDRGVEIPAGPRGRRGPRARRPALPPHRQRRLPDHPADDRPPPDLTRRPALPGSTRMEPGHAGTSELPAGRQNTPDQNWSSLNNRPCVRPIVSQLRE